MISLAKEGVLSCGKIHSLERELHGATVRLWDLDEKLTKLVIRTRDFKEAMRLAPQRVKEVIDDIFQKDKEAREQKKQERKKSRSRGISR